MNSVILQVFYAIFSGAMQAFAISNEFNPFGNPFLALFCLVPFYIVVYNAKSYKHSFWLMAIQTLTVHLISSFWLANYHGYGIFTLGASAFGTALEGGMCGIIIHIYPSVSSTKKLQKDSNSHNFDIFYRILWFTACWVMWEWFKSTGDMAYSWGTLFQSAYRLKIITQIASVTGVWGITFLFALFNSIIAEGILLLDSIQHSQNAQNQVQNLKQACKLTFAFVFVVFIYGTLCYINPIQPEKELNTIIVQPNSDPWASKEKQLIETSKELTLKGVKQFEEEGKETDLVLWSEGVLSHRFPYSRGYYDNDDPESLSSFIANINAPFVIGGLTSVNRNKGRICNSAIFFDSFGKYSGFYSKMHLVPFAEGIPYGETPIMTYLMDKLVGMSAGLTKGNQFVLFRVPIKAAENTATPLEYTKKRQANIFLDSNGKSDPQTTIDYIINNDDNPDNFVKFTTPICFEDAYADVCTPLYNLGSEVFMNITNDSWSMTKSAEYQHFIVASYLSIEYRTTLVRCCNSGYSVVVNPKGQVIADLPLFEEGVLACSVPIYKRSPTIFSQYGDWFVYILIMVVSIVTIFQLFEIYIGESLSDFIKKKTKK